MDDTVGKQRVSDHDDAGAKQPYHHGDLRKALLEAAEAELTEKGVEGFTLRGCAKRAGVSHAAPAHHFRDANGLLTALAAIGFERFLETQRRRQGKAGQDPVSQQVAAGLGYIDFALANPALFRLMFGSQRIDFEDPALQQAGQAGYEALVDGIRAVHRTDPRSDPPAGQDVLASWAIVHGLADLLLSGRMKDLHAMPTVQREHTLTGIIRRGMSME